MDQEGIFIGVEHAQRSVHSILRKSAGHLRWRSKEFSKTLAVRGVADVHRDRRRGLYLCSWQRSGSTWLAQMISSAPRTRLVYEPANVRQGFYLDGEPRLVSLPFAGPGDNLGDDGRCLDRAMRGSLQTRWTNQLNVERLPLRRVVKDIRTVAVLPWIADRFDDAPLVMLVRHPLAVAHSIIELGWTLNSPTLDDPLVAAADPHLTNRLRSEALVSEVTLWAAHHAWAMSHPAVAAVHVVFYEDLVARPAVELERLRHYLSSFHEVWQTWEPDQLSIARPSATAFRGRRTTPAAWVDTWSTSYDSETIDAVTRILAAYGLDPLYGASPNPLTTGEEALCAVRSRRERLD